MPNSSSGRSTEEVCSEIKKIEENPQDATPGPAINNLPAVRGGSSGHFDGHSGSGGKHHHRE